MLTQLDLRSSCCWVLTSSQMFQQRSNTEILQNPRGESQKIETHLCSCRWTAPDQNLMRLLEVWISTDSLMLNQNTEFNSDNVRSVSTVFLSVSFWSSGHVPAELFDWAVRGDVRRRWVILQRRRRGQVSDDVTGRNKLQDLYSATQCFSSPACRLQEDQMVVKEFKSETLCSQCRRWCV